MAAKKVVGEWVVDRNFQFRRQYLYACFVGFCGKCIFIILDALDQVSMAGLALMVAAAGAVSCQTTVLLTPEEIDQAVKLNVDYWPPAA